MIPEKTMVLVNVGSGDNPLEPDDLKEVVQNSGNFTKIEVYNLDNQYTSSVVEQLAAPSNCYYLYYDVDTATEPCPVDIPLADIVVSISPFNYSAINNKTISMMKDGAFFIVMGNAGNKWLKESGGGVISSNTLSQGKFLDDADLPLYIRKAKCSLKDSYISLKTSKSKRNDNLFEETLLNKAVVWYKCPDVSIADNGSVPEA